MPPMGVDIKLLKKKRRRRAVWGAVILLSLACVYFPDPYEVAQTGSRYLVNLPDTKTTGPGSKPNFVVFMLSQWRYDWDGLHPHGVKGNAPLKLDYFKEVAKTGTRFTQAYSPSPLTAPARACFAMGKEYDATGVLNADPNGLVLDKEETTTFYKLLRDVGGYHTMMVGADELYPQDARFPTFPGEFGTPAHDLGFSDAKRIASNTAMNDAQHKDDLYKNYLELVQVEANNSTFSGLDVYKDCMKGSTSSLCLNTTFTDHIHPDHFVANAAQELLSRRKRDKPYYLQVNFPALSLSTAEMAERVKDRFWPPPFDNVHPEQWACPEYTGACSCCSCVDTNLSLSHALC